MKLASLNIFTLLKRILVVTLATGTCSGFVYAAGDPSAGEAQAAPCGACHGQDGATPLDPSYPNLAGQNEKYLTRQLELIASGERSIPLMAGQLDGKSPEEIADLAAYYASLPNKISQAEGDDEQIAKAQKIYRGGIARKGVAACSACHSPRGLGNDQAGFPRLGGQPKAYTIAQLTAYREGQRATDEGYGRMMRDIAEGLTDTEIAALADYLQGLN
ncbi:MAG: c-type cytochrome [Pseudomonadota bacterium]